MNCVQMTPLQSQLAEVTDALALRQSFQDFIAPTPCSICRTPDDPRDRSPARTDETFPTSTPHPPSISITSSFPLSSVPISGTVIEVGRGVGTPEMIIGEQLRRG